MTFDEEFPNVERVEIKYDSPSDIDWLCPDNISFALQQVCTNTKFKVKRIDCLDKERVRKAIGNNLSHDEHQKEYDERCELCNLLKGLGL